MSCRKSFVKILQSRYSEVLIEQTPSPHKSKVQILHSDYIESGFIAPSAPANFEIEVAEQENTKSLSFDGDNDFVAADDYSDLRSVTLFAKVKFNSLDSFPIAITGQGILDTQLGFGLTVNSSEKLTFQTRNSDSVLNAATTGSTETDKWYSLVGVRDDDAEETRLYIDGELIATVSGESTSDFDTDTGFFDIGCRSSRNDSGVLSRGFFADALIDEVHLWNRALSEDEIKKYIHIFPNGDEDGLIGYWNCEDEASDLTDLSNSENDGTIDGATYSIDTVKYNNGVCTWDAVPDVDGYNIYLSDDGETFEKQNSNLITDTEYTLLDLGDGDYEVYVVSFANELESEPSNVVEFEMPIFAEPIFEDQFDDNDSDPDNFTNRWSGTTPFRIDSSSGNIFGDNSCRDAAAFSADFFQSADGLSGVEDAEILSLIRRSNNTNPARLHARATSSEMSEGYYCEISGSNTFSIKKLGPTTTLNSVSFPYTSNTWYWVRFSVVGNAIKAKIWEYGEEEPSSWMVEAIDSDYTSGLLGTGFNHGGSTVIEWDYFAVSDGGKLPLPE